MPIEINRLDKPCPKCKNPTIFDIGKKYVCGKCMSDINKNTMEVISTVDQTVEEKISEIRADAVFSLEIKSNEKIETPDVIIDPQIMVDSNVSTPVM